MENATQIGPENFRSVLRDTETNFFNAVLKDAVARAVREVRDNLPQKPGDYSSHMAYCHAATYGRQAAEKAAGELADARAAFNAAIEFAETQRRCSELERALNVRETACTQAEALVSTVVYDGKNLGAWEQALKQLVEEHSRQY